MRAAVLRDRRLVIADVEEPEPGPGQVLVETLACGICGSDLHFLQHGGFGADVQDFPGDQTQDLIMGHEFSARVVALGSGVTEVGVGDVVVSVPTLATEGGTAAIGYSNASPGGYAERMLLTAAHCIKVPERTDPKVAALTEPLAVGRHAVNLAGIANGEGAMVHGCGPIGLAIISALALDGAEPIVAADFSRARRELARLMGAHEVVDPKDRPAIEAWRDSSPGRNPVIFEAVGVPGMIDQAMRDAPRSGRVVVAGVCMEADTILPIIGIYKELTVQFALGYTADEFGQTLHTIAAGRVDAARMITDVVGLDDVPRAFEMLAEPGEHVKVIVTPNDG